MSSCARFAIRGVVKEVSVLVGVVREVVHLAVAEVREDAYAPVLLVDGEVVVLPEGLAPAGLERIVALRGPRRGAGRTTPCTGSGISMPQRERSVGIRSILLVTRSTAPAGAPGSAMMSGMCRRLRQGSCPLYRK